MAEWSGGLKVRGDGSGHWAEWSGGLNGRTAGRMQFTENDGQDSRQA
ncbi:MAG: hypothetical protein HFH91_13110 [Lachnospiraceae bacterium]|nr:hypothetical protein [Lachnospiraceae bacterium]